MLTLLFRSAQIPAALLLGPMIAGILAAVFGVRVYPPRPLMLGAQAVVGCVIAHAITRPLLGMAVLHLAAFLGFSAATLAACSALGFAMARFGWMPGTTAIWGLSPGAAAAMVIMADASGADARLVAVMQYFRVLVVVAIAVAVARIVAPASCASSGCAVAAPSWFPPIHPAALAETLLVAAAGIASNYILGWRSSVLLIPALGGAALQISGLLTVEVPPVLSAIAYALIGLSIGLRFTRGALAHAARMLPAIGLSLLAILALCGVFAVLMAHLLKLDLLTSYLATSPGGIDSIVIIASSTGVDLPVVLAAQLVRFLLVLIAGPIIARAIATRHATAASRAE